MSHDNPDALHSHYGGDLRAIQNHIRSGKKLEEVQTDLDSLALDVAAGEWESVHKTMTTMLDEGSTLQYIMRRIHGHVKSVGMTTEQLYAFFAVWGDFILRMNQWDLDSYSFVDYFIATLHNGDKKQ